MERKVRHKQSTTDPITSSESLTTSTESESFETWTLVTEGTKKRPTKAALEIEKPLDEEDRVELIEKDENNKRDNENVDDLSDGISIISDNESAGRVSPNLLIGEGTDERHFPLISEISSEFEDHSKNVQYQPLTPPASPREIELCSKTETQIIEKSENKKERPSSEQSSLSMLGIGVRGVFCISIIIAIAAFIAQMKYPQWEQLSLRSQISPLNQRIEDLELQNNLLRAEIDLLNKQVKYLTDQKGKPLQKDEIRDPYRQDERQNEAKTRGSPKIWSGADDLDLDEPKESYFKTPSKGYHKQREPAANTVNTEKQYTDRNANVRKDSKEFLEQRQVKEERKHDKERKPYENHKSAGNAYPSYSGKYDPKYAKHDTGSGGKHFERENWRKDKRDYNSREHFEEDSHETHRKQKKRQWDHEQSREKLNNKRDKNWKDEDDWHEKMMQHREDTRKKQDQHNSNNWYIERANSREEARVVDKEHH